jgi:hypothetical protein
MFYLIMMSGVDAMFMIGVCMLVLYLLLFYDDVSSSSLSSVEIFLLSVDPSFNCRQWEFWMLMLGWYRRRMVV